MNPVLPPPCHYVQVLDENTVLPCWRVTGHTPPHNPRWFAPREPKPGDVDKDTNRTLLMGSHPPLR